MSTIGIPDIGPCPTNYWDLDYAFTCHLPNPGNLPDCAAVEHAASTGYGRNCVEPVSFNPHEGTETHTVSTPPPLAPTGGTFPTGGIVAMVILIAVGLTLLGRSRAKR